MPFNPFIRSMLAATATVALVAGAAQAQELRFPADAFDDVDVTLTESMGGAVSAALRNQNLFYRIGRLRPDDPIRVASEAIFRLNILAQDNAEGGEEYTTFCTASLISERHVLTNYHCIPSHDSTVRQAAVVVDYLVQNDDAARFVAVETTPLLSDPQLDFAVVALTEPLPRPIAPLAFQSRTVRPGERLVLIHHPAGQPKMMTQHDCRAHQSNPDPVERDLLHVCDSLPGSSGGILFSAGTLTPIGLHFAGGLIPDDPDSFNRASALGAFLDQLAQIVGRPVADDRAAPQAETGAPDPARSAALPPAASVRSEAPSAIDLMNDAIGGGQN